MKLANNLVKAPEVATTMQEFGKEMTKVSLSRIFTYRVKYQTSLWVEKINFCRLCYAKCPEIENKCKHKTKHTQFTWFGNLPTSTGGQQFIITQRVYRFSQLHTHTIQEAHAFIQATISVNSLIALLTTFNHYCTDQLIMLNWFELQTLTHDYFQLLTVFVKDLRHIFNMNSMNEAVTLVFRHIVRPLNDKI